MDIQEKFKLYIELQKKLHLEKNRQNKKNFTDMKKRFNEYMTSNDMENISLKMVKLFFMNLEK
jgi:hypothetical protein